MATNFWIHNTPCFFTIRFSIKTVSRKREKLVKKFQNNLIIFHSIPQKARREDKKPLLVFLIILEKHAHTTLWLNSAFSCIFLYKFSVFPIKIRSLVFMGFFSFFSFIMKFIFLIKNELVSDINFLITCYFFFWTFIHAMQRLAAWRRRWRWGIFFSVFKKRFEINYILLMRDGFFVPIGNRCMLL